MGDHLIHVCPECVAGKHSNCHGDAWCLIEDAPVDCGCSTAGHPATLNGEREGA